MKKFIIAVLIAMMLCLTGCDTDTEQNAYEGNSDRFKTVIEYSAHSYEIIDDAYPYAIIVDEETGFQYLILNPNTERVAITQMIGEDGKPIVAEGWNNETD